MSRKPPPSPPDPRPSPAPATKAASAFLEIDRALAGEIDRYQKAFERIQRAAELDPDDPGYMDKIDEIAAEIKAARAEDEKRQKSLKMLTRKVKSPDARWRAQRLAKMKEKP